MGFVVILNLLVLVLTRYSSCSLNFAYTPFGNVAITIEVM
jgi:hypothetical protein